MIITLDEAKSHLNVTDDADDALITSKIKAAQGFVASYVDCEMTPDDAPDPVKEAVKMLVGTLYENRESFVLGEKIDVLAGPLVLDLIGPWRRWVF